MLKYIFTTSIVLFNLSVVKSLENLYQSLCPLSCSALRHINIEELSTLCKAREADDAHAATLIQSDTQIFNEMFNVKTWFEVSFQHSRRKLF